MSDSDKLDWIFWWNVAPVVGVLIALALLVVLYAVVRAGMAVHRAVRRAQGWNP